MSGGGINRAIVETRRIGAARTLSLVFWSGIIDLSISVGYRGREMCEQDRTMLDMLRLVGVFVVGFAPVALAGAQVHRNLNDGVISPQTIEIQPGRRD